MVERDAGPWKADIWRNVEARAGRTRVVIQSDDFEHDVALEINGDFADTDSAFRYAQWLAEVLTKATSPETGDPQ